MIETLLFSLVLFASLWGYFVVLDVMNFTKDPNAMEEHLDGRPARRTIGRKNEDVSKSLFYIYAGYLVLCAGIYGLLDYKDLLSQATLVAVAWFCSVLSMFLFSPANRLMHAYSTLGHISTVHLTCALSAFLVLASVLYGYKVTADHAISMTGMIIGAMLIWSRKPGAIAKVRKKQEKEVF